jgi:hypothetical protein
MIIPKIKRKKTAEPRLISIFAINIFLSKYNLFQ